MEVPSLVGGRPPGGIQLDVDVGEQLPGEILHMEESMVVHPDYQDPPSGELQGRGPEGMMGMRHLLPRKCDYFIIVHSACSEIMATSTMLLQIH